MGFAAVALRYAFPVTVYAQNCTTDSRGRSVTMQSISSSLKVIPPPYYVCVEQLDRLELTGSAASARPDQLQNDSTVSLRRHS